jgi:hypothetical protein
MVAASFVNRPSGGKVETVLTFATQRFTLFAGFRIDFLFADDLLVATMVAPSQLLR